LCKYDPVPVCGTSTTTTESTTTTTTQSTTTTTTEPTTTTTTTIVGPCTIDYITPDRGPKGTEALDLTITGPGFDPMQPVTVSFSGTGITVTDSTVNSETLITAVINIAETAEVVVRTVTVKQGDITCTGQFAVECLTITPAAVTRGIFFPRLRTSTISSPEGNFNRTSRVNIEDFIIAIPLKGTITLESMRVLIVVPPRLRRRIDYAR
jgi:hypothetical protein